MFRKPKTDLPERIKTDMMYVEIPDVRGRKGHGKWVQKAAIEWYVADGHVIRDMYRFGSGWQQCGTELFQERG